MMKEFNFSKSFFLATAILTASIVVFIFIFLFYFSYPVVKSGLWKQFFTFNWYPDEGEYGIYPMVIGTFYIAILATFFAVLIGSGIIVFINVFASNLLKRSILFFIEFMTGIPTVVYGFAAIFLLVPVIRKISYTSGFCILSASLVLCFVILPTIVLVSQAKIEEMPNEYLLGAISVGANPFQTFIHVTIPFAWRGIMSGIILGGARALGDTMISLMLAGNAPIIPISLFDSSRTLTSHIALSTAGDFDSMGFKSIFISGIILFIFSAWNILFIRILEGKKR